MYIWGGCKKYKLRGNIMTDLRLEAIKIVSIDKASGAVPKSNGTWEEVLRTEIFFLPVAHKGDEHYSCLCAGCDWSWMKRSDLVEVKNRERLNLFYGIIDRLVTVYQPFLCANVVEACKIINHPKVCVDVKRGKWRLDTTRFINVSV